MPVRLISSLSGFWGRGEWVARPALVRQAARPCLGVLLAGGRSSRMGSDKAQLDWAGLSLLEHALQRFNDAGIAETVVSGDRPAHRGIVDVHPGQGPLAGLFGVARAYPGRRLLVMPVDMPRLPAHWLSRLARALPDAPALQFAGAPLPLRLDATPELVGDIARWLDDPQGPRALRYLLRHANAVEIRAPERARWALDNANTPEDMARIAR